MEHNQALEVAGTPGELTVVQQPENILTNTVIGKNGAAISEVLMQTIENVRKDPAYIPQANAIRDAVGSMIDLAKTEVQAMVAVSNIRAVK